MAWCVCEVFWYDWREGRGGGAICLDCINPMLRMVSTLTHYIACIMTVLRVLLSTQDVIKPNNTYNNRHFLSYFVLLEH